MAFAIFIVLASLALAQGVYVLLFRRGIRRRPKELIDNQSAPKAALVLCLRGRDPFLPRCIEALLRQDYPNYVLHVIVDHPDDPAWTIVNETVAGFDNLQLHTLNAPADTCSLKCSSLIQVISSLDTSYDFVALADADTIPDQRWLRRLATELQDDNVGAVTGIRWYQPTDSMLGSLVRFVWNAAAIVQMYLYGIAWGGTLAIKLSVIEKLNLLERWRKAFCEDTMLSPLLRTIGLTVRVCPQLFVSNGESSSLSGCYRFVTRQLLTVRLHHPGWWLVVGHGLALGITNIAAIVLGAVKLITGDWHALTWIALGLAIFHISNIGLIFLIAKCATANLTASNTQGGFTIRQLIMLLPSIPLTLFLQLAAVLKAIFLRSVTWRGITYEIAGTGAKSTVKLKEYLPTKQANDKTVPRASL